MFDRKIFASRLIGLRKAKDINQLTVSQAVGLGRTSITMLEKFENAPSVDVLVAMAEFFDVSIDYLAGRTNKPEVNR